MTAVTARWPGHPRVPETAEDCHYSIVISTRTHPTHTPPRPGYTGTYCQPSPLSLEYPQLPIEPTNEKLATY
ncbi:hypothetical protein J6590_008470 [Homalodisca vitripennis]|nr:hypothetical protein J6590_008470 [Homalodisca vitripennis]